MGSFRRTRRPRPSERGWATLPVLLLASTGCLRSSRSVAQAVCGVPWTTPFRVENDTAVSILREAANCTDGGSLKADWVGTELTIGAPIAIAPGTSLSLSGENALAEVHGGLQTRMFEVSPGGELTLTRLKLSGGAAKNGGAISSDSATLTLDGCTFDGNVATDGDGGAVWADKGTVTIIGGEFLGNSATRYGGAVFAKDADLVIQGGSRYETNEASIGGALFCGGVAETGLADAVASGLSCSIRNTEFASNVATGDGGNPLDPYAELDGGGAAAFLRANVTVVDSNFSGNYALRSGGALYGGNATNIKLDRCTFGNNTADRHGGAILASSLALRGSTRLADNAAFSSGGGVFGWDAGGTIVFNDVVCTNNSASNSGGCLCTSGTAVVNNGTVMHDNVARNGGCIYADEGSEVNVDGGDFMCRSTERGGFLFAGDRARAKVTGGLVAKNVAVRRGGAVYCEGGVSAVSIEGGTFRDNSALEVGGAIVAWGGSTVVNIAGGEFINNTAKFYGGFAFLEEEASLNCKGAIIRENVAGDQGGGIYAREAVSINSSCDLIANESPQGAALYLTHVESATFDNHSVTGNLASGGSVVYLAASSVVARGVTFESSNDHQEDSSNRAIQTVGDTMLRANQCTFENWAGDTVIYHTNSVNGSLVLDSCGFRRSSATMAVTSPNSDAEIRNAVVDDRTFANAIVGKLNSSSSLVDRALDCSDSSACGAGACVDSALGVLCECLEGGECLDDGGGLSLSLKTSPAPVTFSPNLVSYTLDVSSAEGGATYAIWNLKADEDYLALDIFPSNGVLPPGGSATITVRGTSMNEDVQGNLTSSFVLSSAGSAGSNSTNGVKLVVSSTFYLCYAHEYAMPLYDDGDSVPCEQCATIDGDDGVNCNSPGVTLASLPIREGYWRSSRDSLKVHECLHLEACAGATEIANSDDYCAEGYKGPYCAVCAQGYGRGVSNSCHNCDGATAHALTAAGTLFSLAMILLLLLAAVFLVGGLDAIDIVRDSVVRTIPFGSDASCRSHSAPETSRQGQTVSELRGRMDSLDDTVAPTYEAAVARRPGGGGDIQDGIYTLNYSASNEGELPCNWNLGTNVMVGTDVDLSQVTERYAAWNVGGPARQRARPSTVAGASHSGAQDNRELEMTTSGGGRKKCCGFGETVRRWVPRLPLNKLKILLVVWQILAVFSSITGVEFPASYSTFLSWISVVNLDLGNIFSGSCVFHSLNFYARLLISTIGPLVLICGLILTHHLAKRLAGIGSAGVIARRAAWSRHVAAGLFLLFLVFTSVSTAVFKTFVCDDDIVVGESFLRADYSISCNTSLHTFFKVYAGLMILVYPLGIPVLYAAILWDKRDLLNPRICPDTKRGSGGGDEGDITAIPATESREPPEKRNTASEGQTKNRLTPQNLQELDEKVKARREHPELIPSMFLWKDFGPELYYYEVIECGRRVLLTGVLIFISPSTATQAAMACIFAFGSLLGFELMRPHLDQADSWLYRLGCVIIFLSNFLALLIKVDAGEGGNRAAFGALLVAVNVFLVLAVIVSSWFATQQSLDDSREEENAFTIAKTMLTADQRSASKPRLTRRGRAPMSSASSSVRPYLPPSDPDAVWRDAMASRERHGSSATDAVGSEDTLLIMTRDGRVSSATVGSWQHNGARASPPFSSGMA